ncbi:P5 protein [Emaravirus idaeobati]|uniref:p5 protein n=2 Tax=Emaravirus idaeobati TaxID=1980431 RepID=F8K9Z1_9VIRU|nr:P5 protein [Emaravirus idaeobati]CBZ42028.1 P5 protein [Emaravirus idaeobati]
MAPYRVIPLCHKYSDEDRKIRLTLNSKNLTVKQQRKLSWDRLKIMFDNDHAHGINESFDSELYSGCFITYYNPEIVSEFILNDMYPPKKLFFEPRSGKSACLYVDKIQNAILNAAICTAIVDNYQNYNPDDDFIVEGHVRCNVNTLRFIFYYAVDMEDGVSYIKKNFESILKSTVYNSCISVMTSENMMNLKNFYYDQVVNTRRESMETFLFKTRFDILPSILPQMLDLELLKMSEDLYKEFMTYIDIYHSDDRFQFIENLKDEDFSKTHVAKFMTIYKKKMEDSEIEKKARRDDEYLPNYMDSTLNDFYCYKVPMPCSYENEIKDDINKMIESEDDITRVSYNTSFLVPVSLRKKVYNEMIRKNNTVKMNNMHLYYLSAMVMEFQDNNNFFEETKCLRHSVHILQNMAKRTYKYIKDNLYKKIAQAKKSNLFIQAVDFTNIMLVQEVAEKHYKDLLKPKLLNDDTVFDNFSSDSE